MNESMVMVTSRDDHDQACLSHQDHDRIHLYCLDG